MVRHQLKVSRLQLADELSAEVCRDVCDWRSREAGCVEQRGGEPCCLQGRVLLPDYEEWQENVELSGTSGVILWAGIFLSRPVLCFPAVSS